ncbi:MAG: 2'-5' RNA ligase [Candidatus Wildermuthbacteria bacterium RIFCSPLOWO2_02_FULL_47_10]|uniref:RNA 2',3'-cyclic phosphodiesterase n=2 Tax=Candidatus Wildermuthiibacteriota TaxID=1817923 RepID=A0A1G2RNU7_9BACT|nr:MAG: 2'-5' RNA ligase [Parcubacteria group bacterium GW2011_GWA2_47_9]OHA67616.1 MAG: 2'-5' RNA ligase [Candidatus Wildermuthbacteria bacterium RIFCSPHIGHO2_02_FULL_47_17]OHA74540.1 MAG: 2'-5' RNA ligase [Candidatus Wildermuthbacteria bacterium RIFCSPLOWO2_01_FULL_48_35]OHA75221.1 MAG: 2'-5' RNA ligase [Candidatus Wildermuthbacteria bacterium RIFCSPLOWO2_02_FULL_47_10]
MKRKRIFLAINLPEDIKAQLFSVQNKWPDLPARWTKKENLHITLVFLGYILDDELLRVCGATERVALRHKPFDIFLKQISYGPPQKIPPRMVWAEGERSPALAALSKDLEQSLADEVRFSSDGGSTDSPRDKSFSPHVTLARIRAWDWRSIESEERPEVDEPINISFYVSSIEVMESDLKRGGPEYVVLQSFNLAGKS